MDKETIKNNYSNFSTEKLIGLASEIKSINPEFIPLLQNELINRNENEVALSITEYLTSIKYHVPEPILFESILNYREFGLTKKEIDNKLKEEHGIDSEYVDLMRISLKEKGKQNIAIWAGMIIVPLILGIILLTMQAFIGILPLIAVGIGIWKVNKGFKQKKEDK